jgi:uncharacterized protein (UPF0248 family)
LVRKGKLEDMFSRALYADNPKLYKLTFRDFENYKEVSLDEFIVLSENFQKIPASRIIRIELSGDVLYEKY